MVGLFYAFILLMFVSCSGEEVGGIESEFGSELVRVSLEIGAANDSKVWYDTNAVDTTKFDASWNTGDSLTVIAGHDKHIIAPFTVTSDGVRSIIEGELNDWTDGKELHALYPYKEGAYSYNSGHFTHDVSMQVINAEVSGGYSYMSTSNSMKNALLLAKELDVTNKKDEGLSVDRLTFRQVMSFLRFTLKATAQKHKIISVKLKDEKESLFTKSEIWIEGDGVSYKKNKPVKEVTAGVESQDIEGKCIINFALFRTTLEKPVLEIETIDKDGFSYIFTKKLPEPLVFDRNKFNYFGAELDLENGDDFTKVNNVYDLSDFKWGGKVPAGNRWVIKSGSILLKDSVNNLCNVIGKSERDITLVFPDVLELKESVFYDKSNIVCLELPKCKEIGKGAFGISPDLKRVVMPALEKAGEYFFHQDAGKDSIEFVVATNPGVKFECLPAGHYVQNSDPRGHGLPKVNLTLGNKELYESNEYGKNYLQSLNPGFVQYFGSITWK